MSLSLPKRWISLLKVLVFGAALKSAGSGVALRVVYAWMQDYAAEAAGALAWLEATYGAGEAFLIA